MLESTPGKGDGGIAVKDVAELMLASVLRRALAKASCRGPPILPIKLRRLRNRLRQERNR